ncbi:MAG: cytochrome c biogenesis protein ResB [bacterium]
MAGNGLLGFLGKYLGSPLAAVILIFTLAAASLLGTVIPGGEAVYHSPLFLFLLVLIALNLLVSIIRRFIGIFSYGPDRPAAGGLDTFSEGIPLKVSLGFGDAEKAVRRAAWKLRYIIASEKKDGKTIFFLFEKGRLKRWGSLSVHVGILLVILGVIWGNIPGVSFSRTLSLTEGESVKLENKVSLELSRLGIDIGEDGILRDITSFLKVQGKRTLKHGALRVNHPITVEDTAIYQVSCGIASILLRMETKGRAARFFESNFKDGFPSAKERLFLLGDGAAIMVSEIIPHYALIRGKVVNESGYPANPAVRIMFNGHFPSPGKAAPSMMEAMRHWKDLGWITKDFGSAFGGHVITMESAGLYSGLLVKREPALPLVWGGALILLLGLFLVFFQPYRSLRLLLVAQENGISAMLLTREKDSTSYQKEMNVIQKELGG